MTSCRRNPAFWVSPRTPFEVVELAEKDFIPRTRLGSLCVGNDARADQFAMQKLSASRRWKLVESIVISQIIAPRSVPPAGAVRM